MRRASILAALALTACTGLASDLDLTADGGVVDSGSTNAAIVDAGSPDAGSPDAGTRDAGTPDAGTPDASTPDAGTPDASTPDAGTPDASTPDASTPDASTPDASTPDASTLDAGRPDSGSPGGGVNDGGFSIGCGNTNVMTGLFGRSMVIDSVTRTYQVRVPTNYDPTVPLALVFVFHGNGGSGSGSIGFGLQNAPDAGTGAIYVFPDGMPFMAFGVGWDETCGSYDLRWMQQIITSLESTYCIDPRRRFAAGFSWGGDMVNALACCLGPTFRAVANASGGELWNATCPNLERPAFRITYADNDAYPQSGFDQVMGFFRGAHGCSATSTATAPSPCRAWNGCAKPVIECRYTGLGHTFPSGWANDTWAFFSSFR